MNSRWNHLDRTTPEIAKLWGEIAEAIGWDGHVGEGREHPEDILTYFMLSRTEKCTGDVVTCPEDECYQCSYLLCPHHELLHFYHDGCPSCSLEWEEEIRIVNEKLNNEPST